MTKSWRGRIPAQWLEEADRARRAANVSLRELAAAAAEAVGRKKPFAVSAMSDFLRGRIASDDIARGISQAMGLPMPPVSGRDPAVQEWCDLGGKLADAAPELFRRELEALRTLVSAIEQYSRRR